MIHPQDNNARSSGEYIDILEIKVVLSRVKI